jgi:CheY-like chemotaxis protein
MSLITKKKILIVEDEKPLCDVIIAALAEAGFDVLAATDASEAMLQAENPALNLIIVDEDLAGESGIMLTKFLRHNHPDMPTMIYTNQDHEADFERSPNSVPTQVSHGPQPARSATPHKNPPSPPGSPRGSFPHFHLQNNPALPRLFRIVVGVRSWATVENSLI